MELWVFQTSLRWPCIMGKKTPNACWGVEKMGQERKLEKIDRKKLPLFYKIILKLPFPAISDSINIPSGIFWAIIVPIFMFIDWWNSAVVGGYVQREVKKVLEEYMAMRGSKDKKERNAHRHDSEKEEEN